MTLTITTLTAIATAVLFFAFWMNIAKYRGENSISLGDGGRPELLEKIRVHGNFIEWTPFVLILMGLSEMQGGNVWLLSIAGAAFVVGRVVHPRGVCHDNAAHPARYIGNSTGLVAVLLLVISLIVKLF